MRCQVCLSFLLFVSVLLLKSLLGCRVGWHICAEFSYRQHAIQSVHAQWRCTPIEHMLAHMQAAAAQVLHVACEL
jgi:hypothetical protein